MEQQEENRPFLELEQGETDVDHQKGDKPQRSRVVVTLLLALQLFAFSVGRYSTMLSLKLRQKDIICEKFLSAKGHDGYDQTCKSPTGGTAPEVDGEFGVVEYWNMILALLPAMVVALPYGLTADQYGRKKFVVLSACGVLVSGVLKAIICMFPGFLPLRLMWLASLVTSFSGGELAFYAFTFAVATDVISEKRMSMVFLLLGAVMMIGGFLGTYLAAAIDYSIAILLGLVMYCVTIGVAAFTPDTLAGGSHTLKNGLFLSEISYLIDIRKVLHEVARVARLTCRDDKRIGAILLAFPLAAHLGVKTELSLNPFPQSSLFWTILILLLGLIPCYKSPLSKDLWMARIIALIALPGALLLVFSGRSVLPFNMLIGMALISATNSYPAIMRSLLVNLSEGKDIGALYALLGVVQGVGIIIQTPLSALLYLLGGIGQIVSVVIFVLSGVILFCVWPRRLNTGIAEG